MCLQVIVSSYVFLRPDDGPELGPKHVVCTLKTLPPTVVFDLPCLLDIYSLHNGDFDRNSNRL
jgi:hypothetical protein